MLTRLHLDDVAHPGTTTFLTLVHTGKLLPNALANIKKHLYEPTPDSNVPETRSVTLVLRPMDGVAYTTGLTIDDSHKEIHVNLKYIQSSADKPEKCRHEIIGVVTHEMVHAFQWNALGTAPAGLIEGIADFVRLRSGLAPPHWKKNELGSKWDEGYQKTAYFLDWLERQHGAGTVGKINERMRLAKYEEKTFWEGLFGDGYDIDTLYKKYRADLEEPEETPEDLVATTSEQAMHEEEGDDGVWVSKEDARFLGGGSLRRRPSLSLSDQEQST